MTCQLPAFAAVDCGTNSFRLLIVDQWENEVRKTRITRLGEGVDKTTQLTTQAIWRATAALREFRQCMDRYKVMIGRCVATSAVRDATNGELFLSQARAILNVPCDVLSGQQEGALAYRGAQLGLDPSSNDARIPVLDIGGGSTELILHNKDHLDVVSLNVGSVRLRERILTTDPPSQTELLAAEHLIDTELEHAALTRPGLLSRGSRSLLGLAGTIATLAMLHYEMSEFMPGQLHGRILQRDDVRRWAEVLNAKTADERRGLRAIPEGREDVIGAGTLILHRIMDRLSITNCIVSETDILDGIVDELRQDYLAKA